MKFKQFLEDLDPKLAYHQELNPKLWKLVDDQYKLDETVKNRLITIAQQFANSLNLTDGVVSDYVLTGSNANYNWTSLSDIDVHLLLDKEKLDNCTTCSVDLEDCLQAKKSLWNDRHDIMIYDHEVEVYATTEAEKLVADSGTYSLLKDKWINYPQMKNISIDAEQISAKAETIAQEIDQIINSKSNDQDDIQELLDKIAKMRSAGLESAGEFSTENLTFKALRNNGYIQKIRQYAIRSQDDELSIKDDDEIK